ncbi:hypothetical protein IP69_14635 [Bosea sp. AAP35]|uniref:hypothetical protein n=1 Tax=Bosea sp. AAP35 TaxID=1523417 RepID=UPI0006B8B445|nr:hypothetical protein [Bosea sp. AAP35]KPF66547.1 hypothetical protein IP69_14635 [Bosea sp. AAP35]
MMSSSHRQHHRLALWRKTGGKVAFILLVALLSVIGDVLLAIAAIDWQLPSALAVFGHCLVAGGTFALIFLRLGDWHAGVVLALWVGLLGPFGAIFAAIAMTFTALSKSKSIADEAWYRRLSGRQELENELITALRDQRAYVGEGATLHSFREIMESGSVNDKQTILGLIAQSYEPAFSSLLMGALNSHEVAVRASAAAVYARLRDKQAANMRAADALAQSVVPLDVLEAATLYAKAASSGLLSKDNSEKARSLALELQRRPLRLDRVSREIGPPDARLGAPRHRAQDPGAIDGPTRLALENDLGAPPSSRVVYQP